MDPSNSREFREFAEKYEFKHRTSSHYPQSIAKSENAVKIVKILMRK